MCEQCTYNTVPLGKVVPGWGLVRAFRKEHTGHFGLVECNDPAFWFSQVPQADPFNGYSETQINTLGDNSPAWITWEQWSRRVEAFRRRLWGQPEIGWRLIEGCRKAGYHPKDGLVAYWLFHRMSKLVDARRWLWPLPGYRLPVPQRKEPGAFGVSQQRDTHTGVDLHAPEGHPVVAVERGTVVAIEWFTGSRSKSSWYLPTRAVLVEGPSGVVAYGELKVYPGLQVGAKVQQGQGLGVVAPVLKKGKGNGACKLHLELYTEGNLKTITWPLGEHMPRPLSNPTPLLIEAKQKKAR